MSQGNFEPYLPTSEKKTEGHIGRGTTFPFGENVIEVPIDAVRDLAFDCILFQTPANYVKDQYEIPSDDQRQCPRVYLEHDPRQGVPTDSRHVVNDTLVHITHFNRLLWDCGETPTQVVDHAVIAPECAHTGKYQKGIAVINNLNERSRRLGLDVFHEVRKHIPRPHWNGYKKKLGGLGEILHHATGIHGVRHSVIGSSVGIKYTVEHGKSGYLVPPNGRGALAVRILEILPELRASMAASAN